MSGMESIGGITLLAGWGQLSAPEFLRFPKAALKGCVSGSPSVSIHCATFQEPDQIGAASASVAIF